MTYEIPFTPKKLDREIDTPTVNELREFKGTLLASALKDPELKDYLFSAMLMFNDVVGNTYSIIGGAYGISNVVDGVEEGFLNDIILWQVKNIIMDIAAKAANWNEELTEFSYGDQDGSNESTSKSFSGKIWKDVREQFVPTIRSRIVATGLYDFVIKGIVSPIYAASYDAVFGDKKPTTKQLKAINEANDLPFIPIEDEIQSDNVQEAIEEMNALTIYNKKKIESLQDEIDGYANDHSELIQVDSVITPTKTDITNFTINVPFNIGSEKFIEIEMSTDEVPIPTGYFLIKKNMTINIDAKADISVPAIFSTPEKLSLYLSNEVSPSIDVVESREFDFSIFNTRENQDLRILYKFEKIDVNDPATFQRVKLSIASTNNDVAAINIKYIVEFTTIGGGSSGGNLYSNGTRQMDKDYKPIEDLDIATKIYVDTWILSLKTKISILEFNQKGIQDKLDEIYNQIDLD